MDNKLVALNLVLNELGVDPKIESIDDRKIIQKTVYLAQTAAIKLGYPFGWYIRGPYSGPLTRDYYALAAAIKTGDKSYTERKLRSTVSDKLSSLRTIMQPPAATGLAQDQWLELIASYHFLRNESHQSETEVERTMQKEKPTLSPFIDVARQSLKSVGLAN